MRTINKSLLALMSLSALLMSNQVSAMEIPLAGKILLVENDGTAWVEIEDKYQKGYDELASKALQNYLHRPYRVVRFHIHGTDVGYVSPDKSDPHYTVTAFAISTLKKSIENKKAMMVCLEINKETMMPSCIAEIERKDVALDLLRKGLATSKITDATPEGYASMIRSSEDEAKKNNIGVWSSMLGLFGKSLQ